MANHPVLFIPGPTEVDEELRQIMSMQLLGHRDPKFVATVQDVCAKLKALFLTSQNVAFETCAGTALMEASMRNFLKRSNPASIFTLRIFRKMRNSSIHSSNLIHRPTYEVQIPRYIRQV